MTSAARRQRPNVVSIPTAGPESARVNVPSAKFRRRHILLAISFAFLALGPPIIALWYLSERAYPRYVSKFAFSVHREETSPNIEFLGGFSPLSATAANDIDIIADFLESPELVRTIDAKIDLRGMWALALTSRDPVFAFDQQGTLEDMTEYWLRMVTVHTEGSGLITIDVQAFTPEDAQLIANTVFGAASEMINRVSEVARTDATRLASEDLNLAVERLKSARADLRAFRNQHQMVDPSASLESQMGVLSSLNAELAATLIDIDMLDANSNHSDPRRAQYERRAEAIQSRILHEQNNLGAGGHQNEDGAILADIVGDYERLRVDLEFAEQAYSLALASFDNTLSEARRQSRYLAAHINPIRAEKAIYPRIPETVATLALFSFLAWAMVVLVFYSLRDRQ